METSTSDRTTIGDDDNTYYSLGMTYRKTYESPKHYLSGSADWSVGDGTGLEDYSEYFYDISGGLLDDPFLQSLSRPETNKDLTLQTDYVHPFKNGNQLETGLKYTSEIKDNTLYSESYNYTDADWNVDDSLNNRFVYDQDVVAAYVIWNSSIKKFGYQLGLRAEQTYTNSELVTTNEIFENNYFGLFPSVHTAYKFDQTSEISASYSRRISRPRSWFLNPFPDYSDPYNLRRGNPFLEPEYENSYEIGYTKEFKKHSLSASVYYRQTLNEISPYIYIDAEGISNMTFENYNTEKRYGIELVGKHEFFKWWNMTSSFNFNQTLVDAQNLENGLTNNVVMYNIRLMSFFQLPKQTSLQVTYMYNTPWTFAQGKFNPIQSLDLGTKTDLFKNTFSVALSVRDIFNTRQWGGYSEGYNFYTEVLRKRESRIGTLTLTYKFGQQDRKRGRQGMDENYDGGGYDMF
ncbi:MAG: outer membrane beta-barrel family protein [Chitinophagales bacterium]